MAIPVESGHETGVKTLAHAKAATGSLSASQPPLLFDATRRRGPLAPHSAPYCRAGVLAQNSIAPGHAPAG